MNSPGENISAMKPARSNSIITEAEVAGKIGGYFGVMGSDPRITALLAKVFPEVQKAAAGNPASWESAFHGVMAQYEGYAKELGLGMSQAQRDMNALKHANRTDATYASIETRLGADGLRHYARLQGGSDDRERPLSSTGYRELAANANLTERIGVTAKDFAGLERQFGHEALAVAAQQIQDMGLRGKQNLAYAAEYKDLSAALHDGDMDKAWALYHSEQDPEKKKGMLQFMQNAITANTKKLEAATKDMPKDEATRIKQVYENYRRDQSDPQNREAFERCKKNTATTRTSRTCWA